MSIIRDPEANETRALEKMIDFTSKNVLEIGCGDGRLTWRYADMVGHITAIDPIADGIKSARANLPPQLGGRINFVEAALENFITEYHGSKYDLVIFSWSF